MLTSTPSHTCAQVWNSLPQYIKSARSMNDFKKKSRNFLIDKNIHIDNMFCSFVEC